jgi:hypothetical protein
LQQHHRERRREGEEKLGVQEMGLSIFIIRFIFFFVGAATTVKTPFFGLPSATATTTADY